MKKEQVVISLLAGTSIESLKVFFPNAHIVRMMPNLALIYGEGVIGLSSDESMPQKNKEDLTKAFELLGKIHWLPEDQINALTALTGSGPAFFFAIDFFQNSNCLLKWSFLAPLSQNFSAICSHIPSKFVDKLAKKPLIFSNQASFERSLMVEAMVDAGIAMGFTAHNAQDLIYQMLQGSLTLLEKTSKHPGELKWQIASPQGTTIQLLSKLEI